MQASVNERELVLDMLLQITRDGELQPYCYKECSG